MPTENSPLLVQDVEEPFIARLESGRHADPLDDNYYILDPVSDEVLAAIQAENPDVHHAEYPPNRISILAFTHDEGRHFYLCTRCFGPMKRSWWSVFFWIVALVGILIVFPALLILGVGDCPALIPCPSDAVAGLALVALVFIAVFDVGCASRDLAVDAFPGVDLATRDWDLLVHAATTVP